MSLHQDPELKKAVLNLPQKEKDKLLVRLISKDKMLIKQLHYQLLEDENDLEDRIISLRAQLQQLFNTGTSQVGGSPNFSNFTGLNRLVKQASGMVNEHEKVTKDKVSEVEFRIYILSRAIEGYPELFQSSYQSAAHKLHKYISGRLKHVLTKYDKLHEDLQFDFREDLQRILDVATKSALHSYIRDLKLQTEL
ncbi:hypothetical protein HMPREF0765_3150 [Sphingobacterium spiritivorum ATCC 33300]|uniref:Uncharacterized protein n=1 Tax=Sphingobacterium spiritivorum ATCC 33300 TaxID=525372 RepID=C2G0Q0_SPHSI|nr:hypothetical protein [Sphingobacterium spiritivorum]EEI91430.1 hypothetical protein HMPREF0765_3150 [Sphingobacterium spiritivorum ATCC 33300]QQS97524.1 hypothetical protein I6J03_07395 [Sphingobacterium spiritivorum]